MIDVRVRVMVIRFRVRVTIYSSTNRLLPLHVVRRQCTVRGRVARVRLPTLLPRLVLLLLVMGVLLRVLMLWQCVRLLVVVVFGLPLLLLLLTAVG